MPIVSPPDLDPNPPEWQRQVVAGMQANQNNVYASNVSIFSGAVRDWIAANIQNRTLGLPLTTFDRSVPLRVIIYPTIGGGFGQYNADPDPGLPSPVLPLPAPTNPGLPGLPPIQPDLAQAELLRLVRAIATLLGVK